MFGLPLFSLYGAATLVQNLSQNNRHLTTRRQTLISIENNYILRKWFDDEEDEKMRLCYCMYIFFLYYLFILLYFIFLFVFVTLIWFPGWTGYSTGTMMTEVETNAFTVFFLKLYLIAILPFSLPFFCSFFSLP